MNKLSSEQLKQQESMTLPNILEAHAQTLDSDCIAIREKSFGIWKSFNWQDYAGYVKYTALGLKTLGLARGDHLGIIMDNHCEWLFSELGVQALGGISVNLFTSSMGSELVRTLDKIKARFVVVQDQEQVDKLLDNLEKLPHLQKVVYVDPTGMRSYTDNPRLVSFTHLLDLGRKADKEDPSVYKQELNRGNTDDVSVMIMTSGTTGMPRLVMLTHRNFIDMGHKWISAAPVKVNANWISITPPSWIVDQMWGMGVALTGAMTMNFPETQETILQDFRELGPDISIAPSRFWEDLAVMAAAKFQESGRIKRLIYSKALAVGMMVEDRRQASRSIPLPLSLLHFVSTLLVFRPLLNRIGCSRLKTACTGGHPISPEVVRFFRSVGLNLKQCYGLTEACGIFQVQPDHEVSEDTLGIPLSGTAVKISDDGEVLVSSRSNFRGYFEDYEATESSFQEGWLKTGDAGFINEKGHLVVIGRKEDLIRDKQERVFSPLSIETRLNVSPYIKEAVICGNGRPYITALIAIDMTSVGTWAENQNISYNTYTDLSRENLVEALIQEEVQRVNGQLPEHMQIKKFILLYKQLDADDDELTRTGKVRRHFIYGLYQKLIEAMYGNEQELAVKGQVRYRDGQIGAIETTVRIQEVR